MQAAVMFIYVKWINFSLYSAENLPNTNVNEVKVTPFPIVLCASIRLL